MHLLPSTFLHVHACRLNLAHKVPPCFLKQHFTGMCHLTRVRARCSGTPAYRAPELAVVPSTWVSAATDVYGLGITAWALLVQRQPLPGQRIVVCALRLALTFHCRAGGQTAL